MNAAAKLLDRLAGVKQTAPGRWIARCPAHEDRSPSLSIREADGGRVLIHDFGGCETDDVLTALGLQMGDLFDKPLENYLPRIRGGFNARELLELVAHEVWVAALILSDASSKALGPNERSRLAQACQRITAAKDLAYGH